jgi:hypothetical protein
MTSNKLTIGRYAIKRQADLIYNFMRLPKTNPFDLTTSQDMSSRPTRSYNVY